MKRAVVTIEAELEERLAHFHRQGKLLEAQRLEQRTRYDLEMMREIGFCQGIENYSRHLTGRAPGEPPYTLIDYFPRDFLLFVDESHVSIPQVGGMYGGRPFAQADAGGVRFPPALRPGQPAAEVRGVRGDASIRSIYVSATPAEYELQPAPRRWSSRSSARPGWSTRR